MYDELGPAGWSALWSATAQLWETTAALAERIRAGVVADLAPRPQDAAAVRLVLLDAVLGQHDAAWLAAFDGHGDRLTGLAEVARNAGWWWPYEQAVVITERPDVLHRDEAGPARPREGPALAYGDGFALHAWRGMPVPAAFLEELSSSPLGADPRRGERGAAPGDAGVLRLRPVSLRVGRRARPPRRDGRPLRIALDGDEDVVMVEVVNSTPSRTARTAPTGCVCRPPPGRRRTGSPGRSAWRGRPTHRCARPDPEAGQPSAGDQG